MQTRFLAGVSIAVIAALGMAFATMDQATSQEEMPIVSRDSVTVLLDHKLIPPNDFIHLYDSTPYMIMNGHVAAKLPCDENSESPLAILIGQAPDVKPVEMELISELSTPGTMCLYHVDLESKHEGEDKMIVTDVAILNTTDETIRLPKTSSVVIGVNEIMRLAEEHHSGHSEHSEHMK